MLDGMKSPRGVAKLLLAIFATITEGAACTIVSPLLPAGRSFQVHVQDQGRSVSGLPIQLSGGSHTQTAKTGEDGTARFRDIPPGTYQVRVAFDRSGWDAATVRVTVAGPSNTTIPLRWPSRAILPVQSLKGALRWPSARPDGRLRTLNVELLDARTGSSLQSTRTIGEGAFNLETPPPGQYLLRVTPTEKDTEDRFGDAGLVPVEVDERAPHSELTLDFGATSCGMTYAATHACPRQELHITGLSGRVLDASGVSIPRATIRLFHTGREIVEQLSSDEEGKFVSTERFDGTYELTVNAPGFTSLWQTVQATQPKGDARPSMLRIELGVTGSCTHAAVN
jgi:hypothetical protein